MRYPSVKKLDSVFPGKGIELRALLIGDRITRNYQSVRDWGLHRSIDHQLHAANEIAGCYGVEALFPIGSLHPSYSYLNTGDHYAPTLIFNHARRSWSIGDIGSIIERGAFEIYPNM